MSYLYSQALVAEYLPESCSDGEPSAQSNGSHTQLAYLPPDRMTAFSRPSRSGMTFRPLTADRGRGLLMSYLAAFRAKTSALQEKAQASQESVAECGDTWRGSLARFDHDTSSWKTAQHSLLEDSELSSVTWPRSGMTADGQCWELPTLARRTSATDSGLWPTPTVCGNYNRKGASATSGDGLATAVNRWPTPNAGDSKQTGNVANWERRQVDKAAQGINLQQSLTVAVNRWPTPTARIHKGGGNSMTRKDGKSRSDMLDWVVEYQTGMRLNPMWVEWLMGWPLGWTDLKPLEMDKCQPAQQQHGDCLQNEI